MKDKANEGIMSEESQDWKSVAEPSLCLLFLTIPHYLSLSLSFHSIVSNDSVEVLLRLHHHLNKEKISQRSLTIPTKRMQSKSNVDPTTIPETWVMMKKKMEPMMMIYLL